MILIVLNSYELNMPAYKIASADLKNTILQTEIAKLNKPIILSTGGGNIEDVKRAVRKYQSLIIILRYFIALRLIL